MRNLTPDQRDRLSSYVEGFADLFRRREQVWWLTTYLEGLLTAEDRRTAETIARTRDGGREDAAEDVAQALQHFVNQSPWDEKALWRAFRSRVVLPRLGEGGALVVDEAGFLKKGAASAGVQRQFCYATGRKANYQIAVTVSYANAVICYPLAIQLYLPRLWAASPSRLESAGVPAEDRVLRTRTEIALRLLDQLHAEGFRVPVVAGPGYTGADFRRGLLERKAPHLLCVEGDFLATTIGTSEDAVVRSLGDHWARLDEPFSPERSPEGARSACSWLTSLRGTQQFTPHPGPGEPYRILVDRSAGGEPQFALAALPPETNAPEAAALRNRRATALGAMERMSSDLGLDHFEGRSWRGFHHHTCLVALGYGFLQTLTE
jgi:SRSO17 transposase